MLQTYHMKCQPGSVTTTTQHSTDQRMAGLCQKTSTPHCAPSLSILTPGSGTVSLFPASGMMTLTAQNRACKTNFIFFYVHQLKVHLLFIVYFLKFLNILSNKSSEGDLTAPLYKCAQDRSETLTPRNWLTAALQAYQAPSSLFELKIQIPFSAKKQHNIHKMACTTFFQLYLTTRVKK